MITNDDMELKNTPILEKKMILSAELSDEQRKEDEKYMRRAVELALRGRAGTRPNPMVGAVVVCRGRIIGEGYHICQGGPHAEVNALASVKETELLPESTIYVSLEPCSHYGKTPPCADLIISKRLKRCVVGCKDPFAKVDGQGIKKLLDAGIEVVVGVLESECLALNKVFMTYHTLKRPYVTLKWAQSQDGFIDIWRRVEQSGDACHTEVRPVCFSTPLTMTLMHRRRALNDAILVGAMTALKDNPSLTVRKWTPRGETGNLSAFWKENGSPKGNPLRAVIDTKNSLPKTLQIFDNEAQTLVWPDWNLDNLLKNLHERNVQTLLVEGGAETLRHFLEADLWDEIRVETSPIRLCEGVKAPSLEGFVPAETHIVDGHSIVIYRR